MQALQKVGFGTLRVALAQSDPKTLFAATPGGVFKIIDDAEEK